MTSVETPQSVDTIGDFERFGRRWVASGDAKGTAIALNWVERDSGNPQLPVVQFAWSGTADLIQSTLPLPRPSDLMVYGVSSGPDRIRARALVNLFGCTIVLVPEGFSGGRGVCAAINSPDGAAMIAMAAATVAEDTRQDLLLMHWSHDEFSRAADNAGLRTAVAAVREYHPSVRVTSQIVTGNFPAAIAAAAHSSALLAVGGERITSATSAVGRLIELTRIPLLIVRSGGASGLAR